MESETIPKNEINLSDTRSRCEIFSMKKNEIKKKSDFFKIAQSLGVAIPASLLFATNVDAAQVNTISSNIETIENSINLQEENEVMERIAQTLTVVSDDYLADNDHGDHANHTNHADHAEHGEGWDPT